MMQSGRSRFTATVRAAERAMGWGKHFKIRPPDKEDAFSHGSEPSLWGSYADPSQCIEMGIRMQCYKCGATTSPKLAIDESRSLQSWQTTMMPLRESFEG